MKINNLSASKIYSSNAVSMNALKSRGAVIQDFKNYMNDNNLILNAQLTPKNKSFYTEIELSKKKSYSSVVLTDDNGYGVSASGDTIEDAIYNMACLYKGKELYINEGSVQRFKLPNFFN